MDYLSTTNSIIIITGLWNMNLGEYEFRFLFKMYYWAWELGFVFRLTNTYGSSLNSLND